MFIKPDYPRYKIEADKFREIIAAYDEQYESLGLDEVDIDVT